MNRTILLVGALIILGVGGYFLYQNSNKTKMAVDQAGYQTPTPVSSASPESTDSASVKEFTVESNGPNYDVKEIKVNVGDNVKITFKSNKGSHNLIIDEFNIKYDPIAAGQTKVVEFVANKKGSFKYYCSVANHRQLGQEGTLIVE